MATIELQELCKSYGTTEVIRDLTLTIRDKDFTVFVGPSGCGKSTLLRLIAGLEEITSGDLIIDGARVNNVPPAKRGLALVFQTYALYPHMTVAENMSFNLKLSGVGKADRDAKVREAARILHLDGLLERKPKDLSGGQRQRVAIGRAIVRNPKVFLFDEPLSNLDAGLRLKTRLELMKLHQQLSATTIYVTHDQIEAMTMADRIVVMRGGFIEQVGSPMDLYRNPRNLFVAGFIGSPTMNFFDAVVESARESELTVNIFGNSTLCLPLGAGTLCAGDHVTVGVRPENIHEGVAGGTPTVIQAVEHLGSESYVHLLASTGENVTARMSGGTILSGGDSFRFSFSPVHAHVFDAMGKSLSAGMAAAS